MSLKKSIARFFAPRFSFNQSAVEAVRREISSSPGCIVYILPRPSALEFAILQEFCQQNQLPLPTTMLSDRDPIPVSSVVALPLRARLGMEWRRAIAKRWRRYVQETLASCISRQVEVCIVPVSFFAGRGPAPIPGEFRLPLDFSKLPLADMWKLCAFTLHLKALRCEIGPHRICTSRDDTATVRSAIARSLYVHEKSIRGARPQRYRDIERNVLDSQGVRSELAGAVDISQERERARALLAEIAATMRGSVILFFYILFRPAVALLFRDLQVHGLERVRDLAGRAPVVLLPSHRSHFDYVVVSFVLFMAKVPIPYVAAGINLNFWPFGPLARAAGGFFIRRKIGNDRLYRKVLDAYLRYLVRRGHMLEFFIEGGRSRTGGMRQPRLGLLKYLLDGWKAGERDDVFLVPVSISYERVIEESSIHRERVGGVKQRETFLSLLKLLQIFRRQYGTVVVAFREPTSLQQFFSEYRLSSETWERQTEDLAYHIARAIEEGTAVTPIGLTALAIGSLSEPPYREERLAWALRQILVGIRIVAGDSVQSPMPENASLLDICLSSRRVTANSLVVRAAGESDSDATRKLMRLLESEGYGRLIEETAGVGERTLEVVCSKEQRVRLSYYKNSIMHMCLPLSLIAIAALQPESAMARSETIYRLHQFCKAAFLLPLWRVWRSDVLQWIQACQAHNWIATQPVECGAAEHLSVHIEPSARSTVLLFARLLLPYLEGASGILSFLSQVQITTEYSRENLEAAIADSIKRISVTDEALSIPILEFATSWAIREQFIVLNNDGSFSVPGRANQTSFQTTQTFIDGCVLIAREKTAAEHFDNAAN